jgi:Tfp pilus assembly protein PilX
MMSRVSQLRKAGGEHGYVLIVVMMVLVVVGMMAATLMAAVTVNQQHVRRDRSYTESLEVAEAGLNRYLWMVAAGESCEQNGFAIPGASPSDIHKVTSIVTDQSGNSKGSYTMQVEPPSASNASLRVTVTGQGTSNIEVPRTITATIGRPSFSEYVMLTDDPINIGGPVTRQWWGKTHSNTQVQIDTYNINDMITCAQSSYNGNNGVYSTVAAVRDHTNSKQLWEFPVPKVDFATVTADFERLKNMAVNAGSAYAKVAPKVTNGAHGWYIKLGPGSTYQVAQVTAEYESYNYNVGGAEWGGYLRYEYYTGQTGTLSPPIQYPVNGVIFVNDSVWVEGTGVTTRITIAASGQFNSPASTVDINVVGDLTYATLDGTAAVGLVAQRDIKIPMYAPRGKTGSSGSNYLTQQIGNCNMTIHAAMIAQTGREYVNRQSASGPRRATLTIVGSVSSYLQPSRLTYSSDGSYGGFGGGANVYDSFMLHTPPPSFPTVGSFQVLEWQELPNTMGVGP